MNFPFRIVRFYRKNKKCQFYSIYKADSEITEAEKFLNNDRNKQSDDFNRLKTRLNLIRERVGARTSFFRHEGGEYSLVKAFHAGNQKEFGYLEEARLRWYCIRLSERCIILGNGGEKKVARTQDDPHLAEKEGDMRWVDQVLDIAFDREYIWECEHGMLHGRLNYTKDFFEDYDIQ